MEDYFNAGGDAADDYARLLGHRVIIYYQDQRGTDRKLVGKIVEIDEGLYRFHKDYFDGIVSIEK